MPYSVEYKNAMLDAVPPDALSLHISNPGSGGMGEVTGGSYARVTPTWASATNGTKSLSNSPTFNVPAGVAISYIGLWRSNVFMGYVPINQETFSTDGLLTVTGGTIDLNATVSA